jgi:hypothetical protein
MSKVADMEGRVVKEISAIKNETSTLHWDSRKHIVRVSEEFVRPPPIAWSRL